MLIDGEKFACDACVRGHRVSNCQHNDRPLTHINKKGRPVSQCPHCRGLRKSRASHVKCECGEKPHGKEDCVHLEKGDSKMDHHVCCCAHGSRCTCALKKEHLGSVPETDVPTTTPSPSSIDARKPRLSTAQSDGSLTVFTNGHHKPVHKNNHAAHECGLPYKIPRPHSIHGHPGLAQKSMDHLPLPGSGEGSSSQLHDSIVSAQQDVRLVRSEHGSPGPGSVPSFEELNPEVPQLDLPYSTFTNSTSAALDEYASPPSNPYETYMASTEEQPPYSACLSVPPVDWSTFDLPIDNGSLGATYSQPPSYASFEQSTLSRPGLTTTSSSETEDFVAQGLSRPGVRKGNYYTTPTSDPLGAESYRISSRPLYAAVEPTSFTTGNNLESINYDELLQGGTASPSEFEVFKNGVSVDPEAFIHHGLTVQDAQKLAHPGVPTEAMGELTLPATRDDNDPLWAAPYSEDETSADGIDDDPEKVWRS